MKNSFQDGVDSIYNAMVAAGATPGSKDPAGIASGIKKLNVSVTLPITLKEHFQPASNITPASSNSVTFTLNITNDKVTVTGTTSVSAGHGSYGNGTASVVVGSPL